MKWHCNPSEKFIAHGLLILPTSWAKKYHNPCYSGIDEKSQSPLFKSEISSPKALVHTQTRQSHSPLFAAHHCPAPFSDQTAIKMGIKRGCPPNLILPFLLFFWPKIDIMVGWICHIVHLKVPFSGKNILSMLFVLNDFKLC